MQQNVINENIFRGPLVCLSFRCAIKVADFYKYVHNKILIHFNPTIQSLLAIINQSLINFGNTNSSIIDGWHALVPFWPSSGHLVPSVPDFVTFASTPRSFKVTFQRDMVPLKWRRLHWLSFPFRGANPGGKGRKVHHAPPCGVPR